MYKIIGADRKEYGPVPADRIRQWIKEGRANGRTLARADEKAEWKPLAEFAEFSAALAPKAPGPPSAAPPGHADVIAAAVAARGYQVDIGGCFNRSWELLNRNFWLALAASAVVLLIFAGLFSIPAIGPFAAFALAGPLFGGLCWFFLKMARGHPADVGDVFVGFSSLFVPLMLGGLVIIVLVGLGLLLIVPGVYLAVIWLFTLFLIIDKRLDFWPAMEASRKVVNQQWWGVFGLAFLATCLIFGGVLLFFVGLFVSAPLAVAALAYAYEDIFGEAPARAALLQKPGPEAAPRGEGTPAPQETPLTNQAKAIADTVSGMTEPAPSRDTAAVGGATSDTPAGGADSTAPPEPRRRVSRRGQRARRASVRKGATPDKTNSTPAGNDA